jgi:hypothetical protein
MKRQTIAMILILTLPMISGCIPNRESTENRRVGSIHFVQKNWIRSGHELPIKYGQDILATLKASNSQTLKQPEIASAYLDGLATYNNLNQLDHFDLFVFWVEDRPSVDEVEFSFPSLNSNIEIELPISDADAKDNLMAAKQSVIFTARNQWKKGTEIGNMLDNLTDGKNLKVRLLRDKKAVTEWYPVSFIKLEHLISYIPNPNTIRSK